MADSLAILANVALHRPNVADRIVHPILRMPKTRKLPIISVDGFHVAEVNNLKNLPFSSLSEIFTDKVENSKAKTDAYVCNFGFLHSCGAKFTIPQNSNSRRLTHMIKCHILEHLVKTPPGSYVKITQKSLDYVKKVDLLSSIVEFKMSKNDENLCDLSASRSCSLPDSTQCLTEMSSLNEVSNPARDLDDFNKPSKISLLEHTYASNEEKKFIKYVTPSKNCSANENDIVVSDECRRVDCEQSSILADFMMEEALVEPANIYIVDGDNLIVEELPMVGLEIEVETSSNVDHFEKLISPKDKKVWACSFCSLTYVTKKSLNQHVRKKHGVCEETKGKRKSSDKECGASTLECKKTKKMRRVPPLSGDFNNYYLGFESKENVKMQNDLKKRSNASKLKMALTKIPSTQRPIVNISNVWNNINVQYV